MEKLFNKNYFYFFFNKIKKIYNKKNNYLIQNYKKNIF